MSDTEQVKPSIGAQIPYRRDQIEKKTGSLVFDQHLKETLSEVPERSTARQGNPFKRAQVN